MGKSLRWREGDARVAETALTLPETHLVYVADREADMLEFMQRAHTLGNPADGLICQRQIEMSAFLQNRNVRFAGFATKLR